jgi:hypothetical protein
MRLKCFNSLKTVNGIHDGVNIDEDVDKPLANGLLQEALKV